MPAPQPGDEPLEPLQPVEVEVVGRLVEQEDVVAGEQQRRQPGPGGLAAGQRRHRRVERDAEPEVVRDGLGALVEVGAAEGEPALERGGVGVVRARRARRPAPRRRRPSPPGPAATPVRRARNAAHGLAGPPLGLLRQVPDGGVRRADARPLPSSGAVSPGEEAQQRRLAGAVRPDQPDDVAGGDDEVEPGEQGAGAVTGGQAGGLQTVALISLAADGTGVGARSGG